MSIKRKCVLLAFCGGLAACGQTLPEQAALGGAAGTLGALVVNGNPLLGAAVGAAGNTLYCHLEPSKCR